MASQFKTFSESWHRVAGLRAALRPSVRVKRQIFRGSHWIILEDPFSNQFFRIRPQAYAFVARLQLSSTVEEVWQSLLEIDPKQAPGQEEVIHLLTQMHASNLLYHDSTTDIEQLYKRYRERKKRELTGYLMSIMFARIPLFDPDRLVKNLLPYTKPLFGSIGFLLWWITVLYAGKLAIDHSSSLFDQTQSVLAPSNLVLLYLAMVVVKGLHEFGHALVCRHYGGEVHVIGLMLIVLTPLPYMDATSSWGLRSRWQRIFVSSAGMITEFFLAAVATIIWANSGTGIVHSLAYNVIFSASVSTLLFNANPLLKFDGYFIFSDLIGIANLYQRGQQQIKYLVERHCFGIKQLEPPADDRFEAWFLAIYGVLSGIYRVIIFSGIILFVGDQYLILGLLMAIFMVFTWAVVPPMKLFKYLATDKKLDHRRNKVIAICIGFFGLLGGFLTAVDMPDNFRSSGVVQTTEFSQLSVSVAGQVEQLVAQPGTWVAQGDPLVRLSNWEISNRLVIVAAKKRQVEQEAMQARSQSVADIDPIKKRYLSIDAHQKQLESEQDKLLIRAQQAGRWVAPNAEYLVGTWAQRGSPLGLIIDEQQYRFIAVIPQDEASTLFNEDIQNVEVRLQGSEGDSVAGTIYQIIPYRQERLPSPALGWHGGGNIAVEQSDESGTKAVEPFFIIEIDIDHRLLSDVASLHGRTGTARFSVAAKPLLWQWLRDIQQVLQRRYQL